MDIQWLMNNTETAKNVIVSVLSEETADDIDEFKSVIGQGVEVVFDLLREPLEAAGYDLGGLRGAPSQKAEEVKAQLEELQAD